MTLDPHNYPTLTEEEIKARKKRNMILALALIAFMVLILAITMIKLKEGVVRNQDWGADSKKVETVKNPDEISAPKTPETEGADE